MELSKEQVFLVNMFRPRSATQSTLVWHYNFFWNALKSNRLLYGTLATTVPLYNISTLCNRHKK